MIRDTLFASKGALAEECPRLDCPYRQHTSDRISVIQVFWRIIGLVVIALIVALLLKAADSWLVQKSQQFSDRLPWREPIDRW